MIDSHRFAAAGKYTTLLLAALVSVLLLAACQSTQETGNETQQTKVETGNETQQTKVETGNETQQNMRKKLQEANKKLREAKLKSKKYSQKLSQIRNATIQNNSTLQKRKQELEEQNKQKLISFMVENENFDLSENATFQEAKQQYNQKFISFVVENTDLSENATVQDAILEFRKNRQLQTKYRSSFPQPKKDQELQQKGKELRKDIQEAMQKQNPKTQEYLKKRAQAKKTEKMVKIKLMQLKQQRQQGQGGMQKQQQ